MTTPQTGLLLWWNIPGPVRTALRARVPLDCEVLGGSECLVVSVGSGTPLRWLQVAGTTTGELDVRLWEVRRTTKPLAAEVVPSDRLTELLLRWSRAYLA